MAIPRLSLVIVNYSSGLLTKACIESARKAGIPEPAEIFVVDNHSQDDSNEILASDIPNINTYFSPINGGFAKAVNHAVCNTTGEYILILNPDILVLKNAIPTLLQFMDEHPAAGIGAGQLLNPNGTVQESALRFYTPLTILFRRTFLGTFSFAKKHLARIFLKEMDLSVPQPIDWAIGACLCVRRSALADVGLMDERFFLYFEDMDWCRRFWEKGHEVWYVPTAQFAHYHKRESAQEQGLLAFLHPVARIHIRSGIQYFWKYRGRSIPKRHAPLHA